MQRTRNLFDNIGKCSYVIKKSSGRERTAAERNYAAKAARRRRDSLFS